MAELIITKFCRQALISGAVLCCVLVCGVFPSPVDGRAQAAEVAAAETVPADAAWPPDGTFIRITKDGGVSPFRVVYYDVTVRGKTVVLTMVKETVCRTGQRERVRLLDGDAAVNVISQLKQAGAWSVVAPVDAVKGRAADSKPEATTPRYEFWAAWGPQMYRFHISAPAIDSSPALVSLLTETRQAVVDRVEPLPMRDVFHPADQIGYMAMTASEPSYAVIDGWDRVRLPVSALDLKVGTHDVVVTGKSGASRTFSVRIVPGETSTVHVLLGNSTPSR